MTTTEILAQLKSLRNETMFAHNNRNGAGNNQFGVKLGDIRNLAKKIKANHELAIALWRTENVEARLLACLLMKPKSLLKEDLDELIKTIDFVQVADWFNAYVLKDHPEKEKLRETWINSQNKWAARSGWSLTAGKIARGAEAIDLEKLLSRLEKEMPNAAPEAQWTMNTTLAYVGIHHPDYRTRALEIGEKLGLYKDYPVSKGCTSPFAPIWINEMLSRQNKEKND